MRSIQLMCMVLAIMLLSFTTACTPANGQPTDDVPPGASEGVIITPDPDEVDIVPTVGVAEPRIESDTNDGVDLQSNGVESMQGSSTPTDEILNFAPTP